LLFSEIADDGGRVDDIDFPIDKNRAFARWIEFQYLWASRTCLDNFIVFVKLLKHPAYAGQS
jgi:hypothetical protein